MEANSSTIADIFKDQVHYCIPIFQRRYVWEEEIQWHPLWNDLLLKTNERIQKRGEKYPHFMGAIVLERKGVDPTKRIRIFNVIDGQQRLTTLQIFLSALRDVSKEKGFKEIAHNTKKFIFNDDVDLMEDRETETYKVWPTRFDRGVYSDMLSLEYLEDIRNKYQKHFPLGKMRLRRNKIKDMPVLLRAYMYFRKQITDYLNTEKEIQDANDLSAEDRLDHLYRAFLEDFKVVKIQLDDGDDPHVIFETLNDRGKPLLPSDLIRNFIFHRAGKDDIKSTDLYNRHWSEFEKEFWSKESKQGRLKRPPLEFFMQHFLAAKTGQDISLMNLFQEYKTYIQTKSPYKNIEEELEDIRCYSPIYTTLVDPKDESFLAQFARDLRPWDVSTVFPLVFQIMASELNDTEKQGMLSDLLSYIVRRAICYKTSKNYNNLFLQVVRHLDKVGINRKALQQYLLSSTAETAVWPSNKELEMHWLNNPVYDDFSLSRINYILREIERGLCGKFPKDDLAIEHILPQLWLWLDYWPLQTGEKVTLEQWRQATIEALYTRFSTDDEGGETIYDKINTRKRILHTFGNLTLLTQSLDSSVSQSAFSEKRSSIIEQSALALNRYFQNVNEWDEEKIKERGRNLFKIAKTIWEYPTNLAKSREDS